MAEGVDPVRGRPGPRGGPVNRYERREACGCVDRRDRPAPLADHEGRCQKCGWPVSDNEEKAKC